VVFSAQRIRNIQHSQIRRIAHDGTKSTAWRALREEVSAANDASRDPLCMSGRSTMTHQDVLDARSSFGGGEEVNLVGEEPRGNVVVRDRRDMGEKAL
jgi:hypothetical protein